MSAAALATAALALLVFAPLSQAKTVINGFGTDSGTTAGAKLGGTFTDTGAQITVAGVAVNSSGAGAPRGTLYVVDTFNGRINRFSPAGAWERAWGKDVIATFYNEKQRLIVNATGGTFTLTFKNETTDPIPFDAAHADVYEQLIRLGAIGSNRNLTQSSSPANCFNSFVGCTFEFIRALGAADMPEMTVDTSDLDGTATITTPINGASAAETGGSSTGFEICVVARFCQGPNIGGLGGEFTSPQGVAVNQANGHVYVSDNSNRRIQEFDADGNFVRAWGWDVIASGRPGDLGTAAFEICSVAADCKAAAAAGVNGGQFSGTIGYPVTDAAGNLWVPDSANRRIQQFDSTGNFIAVYGYGVNGGAALERCTSTVAGVCRAGTNGSGAGQFGTAGPTRIAFDNLGNLYAIDATNRRVQRFDSAFTTASNFASAAFSGLTTAAVEQVAATQGGTRLAFSLNRNIGFPVERQIVEIDPTDESVKDTSLAGVGLTNVNGLAEDPGNGNLYATTTVTSAPNPILVLGAAPPPIALTTNTITIKTDTTATFKGAVDPRGGWVGGCKFQYSTDPDFSSSTDAPVTGCESFPIDGGSQPVSAGVAGLLPNTTYYVRLQASRPLVADSTVTSSPRFFTTDAPPPVVSNTGAVEIADTSARLVTTIDPRNTLTGYVFEYGATPALGSTTAPVNIGGGTDPITVSQVVGGLAKDTDYWFRAVATNTVGTTQGATATFHTRADPLPPAGGRAYEQVSPVDKNYGDVNTGPVSLYQAGVSIDGNGAGFCTTALFGDPPGQLAGFCSPYISRRTAEGWQTPDSVPDYCTADPASGKEGQVSLFPSADFSRVVVTKPESDGCPAPPLDPAAPLIPGGISNNLYLQDPGTDPFGYSLLNPETEGTGGLQFPVGGTDDFSHVLYRSAANQTADTSSNVAKLYDYHGGTLDLVSRDTGNVPFATHSALAAFPGHGAAAKLAASAVSEGGERIFFSNPVPAGDPAEIRSCSGVPGCQLYVREGGAVTHDVSASECTADCGTPQSFGDVFLSATPSGVHAFFSSSAKLTDASSLTSTKLYRWDRFGTPTRQLVDLTVDHEPSDGSTPDLDGLIGHSDDGETAYFVAGSQLVAGQPLVSGAKIYRWRWNAGSPLVDYLGPYDDRGVGGRLNVETNLGGWHRMVTPDGRYMTLFTELSYSAGDRDTDADLYRWSEAEGWTCVSCQLPGAPSGGDVEMSQVQLGFFLAFSKQIVGVEPANYISDDGSRIFFGTPDALVSEDTNGETGCPRIVDEWPHEKYPCNDVYEWHDGTLNLISSGTGTEYSRLIGTGRSGRDVFFFTRDRLVGWDVDNNIDIYDARLGGGFPEPPPVPPICDTAEGCRGPASGPADIPGAGSRGFVAPPPTPVPDPCGSISKKAQRKAAAARKAARKGQAKRARALRGQARNLNRRAKRCNRRQGR